MRAAKVQASLCIHSVSPEPPLLAHTSIESRQKARSLAALNGWACAVKICHDGMLEDTNSLDAVQSSQAKGRAAYIFFTFENKKVHLFEPRHEKTCFVQMRRLICAFVVRCLDSKTHVSLVSISKISSL